MFKSSRSDHSLGGNRWFPPTPPPLFGRANPALRYQTTRGACASRNVQRHRAGGIAACAHRGRRAVFSGSRCPYALASLAVFRAPGSEDALASLAEFAAPGSEDTLASLAEF